MASFIDFAFQEEYERVKRLGDRFSEIEDLIDWEAFRPVVANMYDNKSEKGGRPNIDEVMMIKVLILQEWHGLSDPELERQITDRISFRKFLGFPSTIPDFSTVWIFRERLNKTGKDKKNLARITASTGLERIKGKERSNPRCNIHHLRPGTCQGR